MFYNSAALFENSLMPNIKPLRKLLSKARDLREDHSERHRPTGFGFALADSVEYLDAARWEALTVRESLFLSRRYLRIIENARPENLHPRYALIFREREAVAAVVAQSVKISVARARKASRRKNMAAPLERLEERMLVCGNLLSWGMHGVAFSPSEDKIALWPAVAEAIYRLRRADKLFGETDLVMVKDFTDEDAEGAAVLSRFSYRPLETDPNMILEISPRWQSYEDYLGSLTSKYRKTAKQIDKDVAAAGCDVEELGGPGEIEHHAETLHALYLQTHHNARLRLVTLPVTFLPTLAAQLGEDVRWTVVRRGEQLLGFVNTVRDGETARRRSAIISASTEPLTLRLRSISACFRQWLITPSDLAVAGFRWGARPSNQRPASGPDLSQCESWFGIASRC